MSPEETRAEIERLTEAADRARKRGLGRMGPTMIGTAYAEYCERRAERLTAQLETSADADR